MTLLHVTEAALQNVSMFLRSEDRWRASALLPHIGLYSHSTNSVEYHGRKTHILAFSSTAKGKIIAMIAR